MCHLWLSGHVCRLRQTDPRPHTADPCPASGTLSVVRISMYPCPCALPENLIKFHLQLCPQLNVAQIEFDLNPFWQVYYVDWSEFFGISDESEVQPLDAYEFWVTKFTSGKWKLNLVCLGGWIDAEWICFIECVRYCGMLNNQQGL